jgi:hypothetical protein
VKLFLQSLRKTIYDFFGRLGPRNGEREVTSADWYEVVPATDSSLRQCDLITNLHVIFPIDEIFENDSDPAPGEALQSIDEEGGAASRLPAEQEVIDAIILTQTCDLEQNRVESVLVAKIERWSTYVSANGWGLDAQRNWRANVQKGHVVHLSLLPPRTEVPVMEWSVINFRKVYSVVLTTLDRHVVDQGVRLRLTPPHREYISQAFARCFMRVALEDDLAIFRQDVT